MDQQKVNTVLDVLGELQGREIDNGEDLAILFCDAVNIREFQIGFSVHPNGHALTGNSKGDWQEEWLVIGCDSYVGDPYFVDIESQERAVYKAMNGSGSWEPIKVAQSLESFCISIQALI